MRLTPEKLFFIHLPKLALGLLPSVLIAAYPASAGSNKLQVTKKTLNESIAIDSTVTLLLSPEEPGPLEEAAKDLQDDFDRVLGKKPRIVHRLDDASLVTIWIGEKSKLPEGMRPEGLSEPESFSISVTPAKEESPSTKAVLLTGADMRGTVYAIYEFSEEYLGIDPLYYWTDHEPARRPRIELPASLSKHFPAPVFKYRGFFINDEDLLTGWAPGETKNHTGISMQVWNKILETILRLKGNMVAPGTWIFSDEPQIKLAGERGLILTQHHAIPLGVNVARWPKDVPYSYSGHREILERAWKHAAAAYPPDQEVLWTVGLRGLSDASYAAFDPTLRGNDKALGELITKAIADQMQIVRSLRPDAKFITSLWQEGARLVQQGYLKIPPEVATVWADTGYGYLQDKGLVTMGQGAYYHVAMMNGRANQLSEMIPVQRIYSELGRYIKAGATHYLLLNTSDIRPVPMTTKAVMDIAWKGLPREADRDSDRFYQQWSSDEFGAKAADKVAEVYKEYFSTPAHLPGEEPALEYGDNYYHTEARRFLLDYMVGFPLYFLPGQAPTWVTPRVLAIPSENPGAPTLLEALKGEVQRCGEAQPRWDALWSRAVAAEALVSPARRSFYRAHVLAMIAIGRESNRILLSVSQVIQDAMSGKTQAARAGAARALLSFDEIFRAEKAAEYGKWKNWYRGDWLTGIPRTHELVQIFAKKLEDPLSPMPPPVFWTGWEAYYHIMHYEGERTADVN
ncbi:MAG TPA: glycosyl hydrolase 115 family protein [Candidatus Dormibacteraeota bacterium]|nr:glycosyl hydrolase 115 family protein [Candidatus Dormibacteraeota bacterium]